MGVAAVPIAIAITTSAISMAINEVISAVMAPKRPDRMDKQGRPGIKLNTMSTDTPLKVVYGKLRIGGNDVYRNLKGSSNNELWVVQTLSEGECDGIEQADSVDQVWLGDKLYTEYGDKVSYWFHAGSSSQTYDTNLHTADANWVDNYRNTTYIVWKFIFAANKFQGLLERTLLLKGRKLYDFRDSSTAWSDNLVLCLYDYMINSRYGLGFSSHYFDAGATGTWASAANYCDTKGWSLNMAIDDSKNGIDWIIDMLQHFRGALRWYDSKFYLHYADTNYESSVLTVNDNMILQDPSGKALITVQQPGRWQKPDIVRVNYINAEKDYSNDSFMIGDDSGVLRDINLDGCADREMAANLATYWLERWQLDRLISLTARDQCVKLEQQDLVTLNTSALAISDQLMRVVTTSIRPDGLIDLTLQYESDDLYNDDYDLDTEGTYDTDLPDPGAEPPNVQNVAISEETYYYRKRTFTRLKITFDEPSNYPWFRHVEVWQSYDNVNWTYQYNVNTDFNIDNVEEGETYYIKLRTVSIWKTRSKLANAYLISKTVQGKADTPTCLTALNAIVNQNTINLYAGRVSDPDVELYEFRLGASWSGGIFLAALTAPNLSLAGVKPGSFTFFCNVLSNNGLYCDTPQQASALLIDPPDGWTVQGGDTQTDDYTGGTHDNTEHTTYSSEDYLKCSHTAGDLSGTYKSPIYDLGASDRYLVYVLADIVLTGAGTTWADVIPGSATWASVDITENTWSQIFELSAAGKVKIAIYYGDSTPPTTLMRKLEILSAIVTARYFQVRIKITDPSDAVNLLVEHFTLKFCQ